MIGVMSAWVRPPPPPSLYLLLHCNTAVFATIPPPLSLTQVCAVHYGRVREQTPPPLSHTPVQSTAVCASRHSPSLSFSIVVRESEREKEVQKDMG